MNTEEYNACVDRHADGVYRFILHNIRDKESARDIVQDAFEKMWLHVDTIQAEKAKSWLFTTAYHQMCERIRRSSKQAAWSPSFEETRVSDNQADYNGLQRILREALSRLPEIQRSVVMLRDYEGYSYDEIGQITGLNESQVKVYIYRARLALKEYIGKLENVL